MELDNKKLEKTSRIIKNSISIILCIFLILLSSKIIDDLDKTAEYPLYDNFINQIKVNELDDKINNNTIQIDDINYQKKIIEKTISTANLNYKNEKESFNNWLQTRTTLGLPDKDKEVTERALRLDEYYKIEKEWRIKLDNLDAKIEKINLSNENLRKEIDNENIIAGNKHSEAIKKYEVKVFLIRLLFVIPILVIGLFFFLKFRKNKFWPIFFGFTLFSLYAFFFGLVPYLPSYGGYIRYSVGIILCISLGYYALKKLNKYIEQKQLELKTSTTERAKQVQSSIAEKAFAGHFCPSCGKDFLLKNWELPVQKSEKYSLVTKHCRYCGLELYKECKNCNSMNFYHLEYCSNCGIKKE